MDDMDYENLARVFTEKWVVHAKKAWPDEQILGWDDLDDNDRGPCIAAMRDLFAEL